MENNQDILEGINLSELREKLSSEELSYEMLAKFSENKKNLIKEIELLDINSDEFNFLIHNLKGVSGNLSLTDVYDYSKKIHESNSIEEKIQLLSKLKNSIIIVMKCINEKVIPRIKENNILVKFSDKEVLKDIEKLLNDIIEGSFITQNRKKLIVAQINQISTTEIAKRLDTYLSNFDYDEAKKILEEVIGDLS
ncbi:MAG: hypothetical protein ACPG9K_00795 [Poseidonibacter sp.]